MVFDLYACKGVRGATRWLASGRVWSRLVTYVTARLRLAGACEALDEEGRHARAVTVVHSTPPSLGPPPRASAVMSRYLDPADSSKPYTDPTPLPADIPKVKELGVTSAPLKSAAFFLGAFCKDYNGTCPHLHPQDTRGHLS